jgi:hypothetical protein
MMKTKRLIISVSLLAGMLVAFNLVIARAAKTSQRQHMLTTLSQLPAETDCVFLGNSLVEAGCDMEVFKHSLPGSGPNLTPANLALGATSPVEHCLILKQALRRGLPIKYVIYGFFDDQLNAPVRGNWQDLVGNRALSYYFPEEASALYAPGQWAKRAELWVLGHVPMFSERSSLWGKVELVRGRFEEMGMPKHKVNRFGRVEDFTAVEAADVAEFARRCDLALSQRAGFNRPVQEIIRLAKVNGTKVILVEMPMPSRHRDRFYSSPGWTQLRAHLKSLAAREDALYVPAADWVGDDQAFEDATHLSEQGAKLFSRQLAQAFAGAVWPVTPQEGNKAASHRKVPSEPEAEDIRLATVRD